MMFCIVVAMVVGAGLGALVDYFGKCSTGAHRLTAPRFGGAIYGALLGLLFPLLAVGPPSAPIEVSENITQIKTEQEFRQHVLQSDGLCMVEFYGDWCEACRHLSPTVSDIADNYVGKVDLSAVNVDKLPSLARRYSVVGMPTVILFEHGRPVVQASGVRDEDTYRQWIDTRLTLRETRMTEKGNSGAGNVHRERLAEK